MPGFADSPAARAESGLQLGLAAGAEVDVVEVLDGEAVADLAGVMPEAVAAAAVALGGRNLFGEAERIAVGAASAATRRQYAAIYRAFGDWLGGELGRPPRVSDLGADAVAAYGRFLAREGGRGGGPAAASTQRIYMSMLRALARQLGRDEEIGEMRVPRHRPGPPETLTDSDYAKPAARRGSPLAGRQARLRAVARPGRLRAAVG